MKATQRVTVDTDSAIVGNNLIFIWSGHPLPVEVADKNGKDGSVMLRLSNQSPIGPRDFWVYRDTKKLLYP